MIIDPLIRTVHELLETNLTWQNSFDKTTHKKAFQFVYAVTGKRRSKHTDYNYTMGQWYGYDTITIHGQKGFIRLALKPLFEFI